MNSTLSLLVLSGYFALLLGVAWLTSRKIDKESFFNANRSSPWFLVSFGMLGSSISGVTFISVPAWVSSGHFSYLQMVLGNAVGYLLIAFLFLPLYYRLGLISIYSFFAQRLGTYSHQTAAWIFLVSRLLGSAARLFLAVMVLQIFIFEDWKIPFEVSVGIALGLIWLYTFRAGIKTIIWTDSLQTFFLLAALVLTIVYVSMELSWDFWQIPEKIYAHPFSQVFFWESGDTRFFWKNFIAGIFITLAMTGIDQDMMQKNLTCKTLWAAQKNMLSFAFLFLPINLLFLSLGVILYVFAESQQIVLPQSADQIYPFLAKSYLGSFTSLLFFLGVTAAAYSSADSALTALTTSFCKDILKNKNTQKTHQKVHILFTVLMYFCILLFKVLAQGETQIITLIFKMAGYTYAPLLALFLVAIFSSWQLKDRYVPVVALLMPLLSYGCEYFFPIYLDYRFGFEIGILNTLLSLAGFYAIRKKNGIKSMAEKQF